MNLGKKTSNLFTPAPSGIKKESEEEFWKTQMKDWELALKEDINSLSISERFKVFNRLFARIIDMM